MHQGKIVPRTKSDGQKGNVIFTKWHGKWDVSILCINCNPLAADIVVNRNSDQQVRKPAVVDMYNKKMGRGGGVDLADHLRQSYSVGHSSIR